MSLERRQICLVIGGGIAAYKALDLIRRLRERGAAVRWCSPEDAEQCLVDLRTHLVALGEQLPKLAGQADG